MRETGPYATAQRLRRHHKPTMAAWWAAEHAYSHPPGKERDFWLSVFDILKKADKKKIRHHPGSVRAAIKSWGRFGHIKRNPPKLDRVVVRYAERVFNDLIEAINSGKLKGKPLYVSPPGVIATREEWQYALQWEDRKIDLIVDSRSQGGATFAPDDKRKPIKIVVKGWKTPSKSMFIHEFTHYLQSKHGLLGRRTKPWVEQRMTVADYLDHPNERDAYFIQFLAEDVVPKLRQLKKMPDRARAEEILQKQFGTKKAMASRVAKYFRASGHWKEMKPQTQKHHIDRLVEFIKG